MKIQVKQLLIALAIPLGVGDLRHCSAVEWAIIRP